MSKQTNSNDLDPLIIGYYPLRGKAQLCRLLCEYLHLPYKDMLFTPKTWEQFKIDKKLNWTFQELPFLKHGNIIITQTYPICLYLLHISGRKDFLGLSLLQQIRIDTQIWKAQPVSYIFTSLIDHRDYTQQVKQDCISKLWSRFLTKKLRKLQNQATEDCYFFKNITLIDFYIYETFYFLNIICPHKIKQFPKLARICQKINSIQQIRGYESSSKCLTQVCPYKFCINWRQRCSKEQN